MTSTLLPDGTAVQFNLMDKDVIKLLDKYTEIQLSKIPPIRKPHLLNQNKITARWFIKEFQRYYIKQLQAAPNIPEEFVPVAELYITLVYMSSRANHSLKPFEDYELRSKVLRSLLYPCDDEIVYNNLGYCHDDSYLFTCLFEIIYKEWDLPELERAVLNNCSGYSHKYRMLTHSELAKKLKISSHEVRHAAIKVEKKVDDLITKFKLLSSYFHYRTNGQLNGNVIELRPPLFDDIKEKEGYETMTNLFIAKVISVTCNYEMVVICCHGRNIYLLIKQGMKDSDINIKFFSGIKRLLDSEMSTPDIENIVDGLVECMEAEFPQDPDNYVNEEDVVFDEFDNSGEDEKPKEEEKVKRRKKTKESIFTIYKKFLKDPGNSDDNDNRGFPDDLTDLDGRRN